MVRRRRAAKWLHPGGELQPWIDALVAVDRDRDKAPLLALLASDAPMPAEARRLLADLLERKMMRRPGGRRTPAYDLSEAQRKLLWAARSVRDEGTSVERAARIYGVLPSTLRNYLAKRHRAARRDPPPQ